MMISEVIDQETMDQFKKIASSLGEAIIKVVEPIAKILDELYSDLEPYQKYEMLHPRKKPRGSIRRSRRKR